MVNSTQITELSHYGLGPADSRYLFRPLTVFSGSVGTGKTTALQMLTFSLSGEVPGLPKQSREIVRRIARDGNRIAAYLKMQTPDGEMAVTRELAADANDILEVTPRPKGGAKTKTAKEGAIRERVYGGPLNSDLSAFAALTPEKMKATLLGMLGGSMTIDIERAISDAIPIVTPESEAHELIESANRLIHGLLASAPQYDQDVGEWVHGLEDQAREDKNETTRTRQDKETAIREFERSSMTPESISQLIADQQNKLDKLNEKLRQERTDFGTNKERHEQIEKMESRIESIERKIRAIRDQLPEGFDAEKSREELERLGKKLSAATEAKEEFSASVIEHGKSLATVRDFRDTMRERANAADVKYGHANVALGREETKHTSQIEQISSQVDALDKQLGELRDIVKPFECPNCHVKSVLPQDAERIDRLNSELEGRRKRLAELKAAEPESLQTARKQHAEAKAANDAAKKAASDAAKKYDAAESATKDRMREERRAVDLVQSNIPEGASEKAHELAEQIAISEQLQALGPHLKQAQDDLAQVGATVDIGEHKALIDSMQAQAQEIERGIREHQGSLNMATLMLRDMDKVQELRIKERAQFVLVKALQRVRSEVLRRAFAPLLDPINNVLSGILPGGVSMNDLGEFVYSDGDVVRPWSGLSSGERAIVGMAISGAIVRLRPDGALKAITIDNAECIGQERLPDILKVGASLARDYGVQVILSAHFDAGQLDADWLDADDIAVYRLEKDRESCPDPPDKP